LLKVKTTAVFKLHKVDMSNNSTPTLLIDFSQLGDIFNGLKTELQKLQCFKNSDPYIAPETAIVGHGLLSQIISGKTTVVPISATGPHV
jgi:hypothetical protein